MFDRNLWKDGEIEKAKLNARQLVEMVDRLEDLPEDEAGCRDLVRQDAITSARSLAQQVEHSDLSKTQIAAAIMLGRGILYESVADALDVNEMEIHQWRSDLPAFRQFTKYWKTITEEEQFSRAIREMEEVASETSDPKVLLGLVKLRLQMSDKPEERQQWQAEYDLRRREVEAKEKVVDHGVSGPPRAIPPSEIVDADFFEEE